MKRPTLPRGKRLRQETKGDRNRSRGRAVTLSRKEDFDRLFRAGTRTRGDILETVVRFRSDGERARVAFVVGAKVDRRAVVRNRIKRRMREAWRREMHSVKDGVDVALVALPQAVDASTYEIAEALCRHLHKAGVIE